MTWKLYHDSKWWSHWIILDLWIFPPMWPGFNSRTWCNVQSGKTFCAIFLRISVRGRKWTENAAVRFCCRCWAVASVVKIHFTIYVLSNFIENAIKSDRAFDQHRVRTKTGLGVQVTVHDYKHSKGTLLVTMLPELHLYLILYAPHYKTIHIWPQHNWKWNKILFKNCSWSTSAHWMHFSFFFFHF